MLSRAVTIIHCNSRNIINKNTMMFNRSIVGAAVAFVAGASSTSAFAPSSCEFVLLSTTIYCGWLEAYVGGYGIILNQMSTLAVYAFGLTMRAAKTLMCR